MSLLYSIFQLVALLIVAGAALKCRLPDGGSEANLKRVTRSCMHKISEGSNYGTGRGQSYGGGQYQYDDQNQGQHFEDYDRDNWHQQDANYNQRSYEHADKRPTHHHQRNRERQGGFASSSTSAAGGGHNESHGRAAGARNNSHNNTNNHNLSAKYDENCVAHCFFDEMNMLNGDYYPDKQKVNYMLTKDLRDRDLRSFYSDTIQECFHYIETQRRRAEKCAFSRELVHCMSEYAKTNCDDWQEYGSVIFT